MCFKIILFGSINSKNLDMSCTFFMWAQSHVSAVILKNVNKKYIAMSYIS